MNGLTVDKIRKEMEEAMATIGAKHGLEFSIGNIRYNETSFRTSLEVKEVGTKSVKEQKLEMAYEVFAKVHGLPKLNSVIRAQDGKLLKIIGWNTRAPKYPVKAEGLDGSSWKLPIDYTKSCEVIS
jgi:hypothetical protein